MSKFYILRSRLTDKYRTIIYETNGGITVNISVWTTGDESLDMHRKFASPTRIDDAQEHWRHCVSVGYSRDTNRETEFQKEYNRA